jgi:hypothetical protein
MRLTSPAAIARNTNSAWGIWFPGREVLERSDVMRRNLPRLRRGL